MALLYCVPCDRMTTELEARLRKFNENCCAKCGGDLLSLEPYPMRPSEDEPADTEPR